jgi:hypothetical protein
MKKTCNIEMNIEMRLLGKEKLRFYYGFLSPPFFLTNWLVRREMQKLEK